MAYTKQTWAGGDTVTAAKLNHMEDGIAGAGGYDAVIRLTHSNNTNADVQANLTPSIESGTYAQLYAIFDDGGIPNIRVEYDHPWGMRSVLTAAVTYVSYAAITMVVSGYFPLDNLIQPLTNLMWSSSDTIYWND